MTRTKSVWEAGRWEKGGPGSPGSLLGLPPSCGSHLRPSVSSCYVLSSTEPYPALMSLEAALTSSQGSPPRTRIHGHGPTQHPWKPKAWVCPPSPGGHPCLLPLSAHNKQRNLTLLTDSRRDSGAVRLDVSETQDPMACPPVQPEIFNKVKPSGSRGCHGPVPPCSSRWSSLKPDSRLPPSPQSLSCRLARLTF